MDWTEAVNQDYVSSAATYKSAVHERERAQVQPDTPSHPRGSGSEADRSKFADTDRNGRPQTFAMTSCDCDALMDSDSIAGSPWGIQAPIGGIPANSPNAGYPKDSSGKVAR